MNTYKNMKYSVLLSVLFLWACGADDPNEVVPKDEEMCYRKFKKVRSGLDYLVVADNELMLDQERDTLLSILKERQIHYAIANDSSLLIKCWAASENDFLILSDELCRRMGP
jgi:hypothetical protein